MIPSFSAEATLYRSRRTYAPLATRSRGAGATAPVLTPAEDFACDGPVCQCWGLPDCDDMFGTAGCGPSLCTMTPDGLTCACIR